MVNNALRLLLIGPLPPPLGGTTVLFDELVNLIDGFKDVELHVVDSNLKKHINRFNKCFAILQQSFKICRYLLKADVVGVHTTNTKLLITTNVMSRLCRFAGKPLIIRKFGGPDHRRRLPDYELINTSYAKKVHTVLKRVDLYLAESHQSVEIARDNGIENSEWFPNNKSMDNAFTAGNYKCRKFIYVGHVKPSKGLREIILAGQELPEGTDIDVYGPCQEGLSEKDFAGLARVHYKGIIDPKNVVTKMHEYDALLMPTYHGGEGYPGVILEAYAAGIPVIASRWQAIPELVDETSGILVEPKNATSLLNAMLKLMNNQEKYADLCKGVVMKRKEFDSRKWAITYIDFCYKILEKKSVK